MFGGFGFVHESADVVVVVVVVVVAAAVVVVCVASLVVVDVDSDPPPSALLVEAVESAAFVEVWLTDVLLLVLAELPPRDEHPATISMRTNRSVMLVRFMYLDILVSEIHALPHNFATPFR